MQIRVEKGTAEKFSGELLILFTFEFPESLEGPIKRVDLEWKGFISSLMNQGDFKGELFERKLLYTQGALPAKRVLLTGLGRAWQIIPYKDGERSQNIPRTEASGQCLTEYRLHVGFLHCPVGFWGMRQRQEIFTINQAAEMQPWAFAGERPRGKPIARRIVEEAGVPREWFGRGRQRGRAACARPASG